MYLQRAPRQGGGVLSAGNHRAHPPSIHGRVTLKRPERRVTPFPALLQRTPPAQGDWAPSSLGESQSSPGTQYVQLITPPSPLLRKRVGRTETRATFAYVWNPKNKIHRNKHRCKEQNDGHGGGAGGAGEKGEGINKYKLPVTKAAGLVKHRKSATPRNNSVRGQVGAANIRGALWAVYDCLTDSLELIEHWLSTVIEK